MIAPLSLANVLTVLIAAICLKMVATQTAGRVLKLPRFLEPRRAELEAKLPPLDVVA